LEEVVKANLLLHVIDVSNEQADEQIEAVEQTISELGAAGKPVISVLNKIDLLQGDRMLLRSFENRLGEVVPISAETGEGIEALIDRIAEKLGEFWERVRLSIPAEEQSLISMLHDEGKIYNKRYTEGRIELDVEIPKKVAERVRQYSLS